MTRETVKYLIAQHIPDVFRQEPRNIGVIVRKGGITLAQFVGQDMSGQMDGRRLRAFAYPDVYRQWVEYWLRIIRSHDDPLNRLVDTSGSHFRVLEGGELTDEGQDTVQDVLRYLYSMLISEGGLVEAFGGTDDEGIAVARLKDSIEDELQRANILADTSNPLPFVRYPVQCNVPLRGKSMVEHTPSFFQRNGQDFIIENVDFTVPIKSQARDHAGLACYMFDDIRNAFGAETTKTICIVRVRPEDEENAIVKYGMAMLRNESELVNWNNEVERRAFIEERRRIALKG